MLSGWGVMQAFGGGNGWNVFILLLAFGGCGVAEYTRVRTFESHVQGVEVQIEKDLKTLHKKVDQVEAGVESLRKEIKDDNRHLTERMDRLIQLNGR